MEKKDLFSNHSKLYAGFRPTYPDELYDFVLSFCRERKNAWDCATGNGQIATHLASTFDSVIATDISEKQLAEAPLLANVKYMVSAAEETPFPDRSFDLITVGQALHWFRTDLFFNEVKRVIRPGGVFAAWGYANLQISPEVDAIILNYYDHVVGPYWDPARRLVENRYTSIEFPFKLIEAPDFFIRKKWTLAHLLGYLESWSATQGYIRARRNNPIPDIRARLSHWWPGDETLPVSFPVFLRIGLPK